MEPLKKMNSVAGMTPEPSMSPSEHQEPTPEILWSSALVDAFLNRSQSIGLYMSLPESELGQEFLDGDPASSTIRIGKLPTSSETTVPSVHNAKRPKIKAPMPEGESGRLRVSHLHLNETFVRSSSTGVNFSAIAPSDIDIINSSNSASPTGFTDPGMSRSWSPISSTEEGHASTDSPGELFDSTSTASERPVIPLYTSARLLRLSKPPGEKEPDSDGSVRASSLSSIPLKTVKSEIGLPNMMETTSAPVLAMITTQGPTSSNQHPPFIPQSPLHHLLPSPTTPNKPSDAILPFISITPSTTPPNAMLASPTASRSAPPFSRPSSPGTVSRKYVSSFDRDLSASDVYISPAQDFKTFSANQDRDKMETLAAPFRKEFTDMFTASQLASLKFVVDLAKDDPNHVLLGLRYALDAEIALRQKQINVVKNWNKEFWKLVRLPDSEFKFQSMKALAQDFVFTSEIYGRLIISEMYLPTVEKTVHPLRMGGIAGGQKFVCQGILFKFAMDVGLDAHGSTVWMYGGSEPCNEYAMKSAKHEFNGIVAVNNLRWQGIANIRVALTTIIDFRGFRLSCQALLPIGKNTLVYGSDNGGNIHLDDPTFGAAMKNVCTALNLKAHPFTPSRHPQRLVYGPVDLEGHKVGKALYAVDLARLFPPESPRQGLLAKKERAQFFRMLRPELVKQFHKPLSSDAHTAFGRDDSAVHNSEVDEATEFLQQTVIPAFAETLSNKQHLKQYTDGSILVRELHRWGINLRYMGAVRARLSIHNHHGRQLLLLEMVLRCLKNMFRRKLRKQMEATRVSMDSPYAEVVLELLNLFLGKDENSKVFWRVTIKEALHEMFVLGLTDDEMTSGVSLKHGLNMQALLDRFQVLTGVKLIPSASTYRKSKNDVILYTDLETVQNTVTKHMQIVDYAEGALLLLLSERKADQAEKLRLLSLAESRLKLARGSAMGNQSLYQLGQVFYMRHKVSSKLDLVDVLNALTYYRAVIESSSDEAHLMVSLKHTLELYYVFVSNSIWLQKKLFGSELISPFLNPLIPLPSPTASLHPSPSLTDSPQIPLATSSSTAASSARSSLTFINPLAATTSIPYPAPASGETPSKLPLGNPNSPKHSTTTSTGTPSKQHSPSSGNLGASGSKKGSGDSHHSPMLGHILVSSGGGQSELDLMSSMATMRRSTEASGAAISTLFHQHCCLVFEKLASLNYKDAIKDASRYVKDACSRQGDSLRWIFEVSLYSPFVRDRLRLYLQRQPTLSVPHCPQLFSQKQQSVVYRFLQNMKAPDTRKKPSKRSSIKHGTTAGSSPSLASSSQKASSSNLKKSSHEHHRRSSAMESAIASSDHFDSTSIGSRHLSPDTSPRDSFSFDASNVTYKLPSCTSLNFTECTPITSTVLIAILSETPYLQTLTLDHCSKISNRLAAILGPVPMKRGPIRLRELSLANCSKITDSFIAGLGPIAENGSTGSDSSPSNSFKSTTAQSHSSHHSRDGSVGTAHNGHATIAKSESVSSKKRKRSNSMTSSGNHRKTDSADLSVPPSNSFHLPTIPASDRVSAGPNASPRSLNLLRDMISLNLSRCRQLTDDSLRMIANLAPKLADLDMSFSKVSDLTPLNTHTLLRNLSMSGTMIRDPALHQFILTEAFRGLHEFHIAGCSLTDNALNPLSTNIHLRRLNITENHIGDKILAKLSMFAPHLSDLDVGTVDLKDRLVLVNLAERLPHLNRVKMVNAHNGINGALISMQKSHAPIQHLEVPWCSVRDIVVHGLGTSFPNLQTIDLTGSQLSNAPLDKLKSCVNLTSLNLSWCTQLVDPTVLEITAGCTRLTSLAIAHCQQVTSHCLHNLPASLTSLDMSHCPGIVDLGPIRSHCIQLAHLSLASCAIPEDRLLGLFGSGISLTSVNLKACKQVSSKFLARMSKYCPLLTKAILDECINITEDGLIPLLSECPYIQRLTLTGVVHVTDRCIVQAVNAHGLRHIKELNLSGCKNITDIAVSAIARNCALLNELSLSGCVNVTSKSVIELADSCQILLSLNIFGCKLIRSDIVSHLAQHCKLLEKVVGVMNSGMADVTVKDLPFLVE